MAGGDPETITGIAGSQARAVCARVRDYRTGCRGAHANKSAGRSVRGGGEGSEESKARGKPGAGRTGWTTESQGDWDRVFTRDHARRGGVGGPGGVGRNLRKNAERL